MEMEKIPDSDPLMIAWTQYAKTDEFQNTLKWASRDGHARGSLWAAFMVGFLMATERAASLHESVDPASDHERQSGSPGAGAMGAVIEYRDLIRK